MVIKDSSGIIAKSVLSGCQYKAGLNTYMYSSSVVYHVCVCVSYVKEIGVV